MVAGNLKSLSRYLAVILVTVVVTTIYQNLWQKKSCPNVCTNFSEEPKLRKPYITMKPTTVEPKTVKPTTVKPTSLKHTPAKPNTVKPTTMKLIRMKTSSAVSELATVIKQLHISQMSNLPPSNHSLRHLQRIMMMINPDYTFDKLLNSKLNTAKDQAVCTDAFSNRTYGIPYYENEKGWVTIPCNAPPIDEVVSIVINTVTFETCSQYLNWIMTGINKTYPTISIYVATKLECVTKLTADFPNLHPVNVSTSDSSGKIWMTLLSSVTTPYVFVARNVFHFTNFSRLERQISIIDNYQNIAIAGGAARNLTGHWSVGCYQIEMSNYALEFVEGYHNSRNECMFCDYLSGPFVARTNIFKEIPLHSSLSEDMLFIDFFLELKNASYLATICPDAMHFANNRRPEFLNKDIWIPVARKWELSRILLPNAVKLSISCEESGLSCKRSISKSYLIPLCCREKYFLRLKKLLDTGLPYEFRDGDALAAVKMRGSIPWDTDTDLNVRTTDKDLWKKAKEVLKTIDYKSIDYGEWLSVRVPDTNINMDPINELSYVVLLPEELKSLPTLVEYDGGWFHGPVSPGLYARNSYGVEFLKHVQSYSIYGHSDPYESYSPGVFLPCPKPHHHACLDHFSTDGNVQFLAP